MSGMLYGVRATRCVFQDHCFECVLSCETPTHLCAKRFHSLIVSLDRFGLIECLTVTGVESDEIIETLSRVESVAMCVG